MPKLLFNWIACLAIVLGASNRPAAQTPIVRASGKLVQKTYSVSGFQNIDLQDLNGRVVIEAGESFGVSLEVNENQLPYFNVSVNGASLSIRQVAPNGQWVYLEDLKLTIRIRLPRLDSLRFDGNAHVEVSGLDNRSFVLNGRGNGAIRLQGRTAALTITHDGNGDVDARSLSTGTASLRAAGNGDISVSVADSFDAATEGNGNVRNYGKGRAAGANSRGNGKVISVGSNSAG